MSSDNSCHSLRCKRWTLAVLIVIAIVCAATMKRWLPEMRGLLGMSSEVSEHAHEEAGHVAPEKHADEHGDHEHEHGDHVSDAETDVAEEHDHQHDEKETIRLSAAAEDNAGISLTKVELGTFERTISVPAMVVARPGRSPVLVAAPLTGVVTRIYPLLGEAVSPGQPLFDLRLTHEEVVEAQAALLQTVEELDVVQNEIDRLEKIVASGAVAGKTLLQREYERRKLEAALRSQRQRLLLHGLSREQIKGIEQTRSLLGQVTVYAPGRDKGAAQKGAPPSLFQVENLNVDAGQHVRVGEPLCELADFRELFVKGKAFEQDVSKLEKAANRQWRVAAAVANDDRREIVSNLEIFSLANTIDPDSRAFTFDVLLPNTLVRDRHTPDGRRFCSWRFKPGQRMELLVPVERWEKRLVLPRDAMVEDGPESYVFVKNDGHFDRRAVRVEYRDPYRVVIENDGAISPGDVVAVEGAYQLHLAMKNRSGGIDPHAGHAH